MNDVDREKHETKIPMRQYVAKKLFTFSGSGGEGSSTTPGSTTGGTGEVEQTEAQVVATASTSMYLIFI